MTPSDTDSILSAPVSVRSRHWRLIAGLVLIAGILAAFVAIKVRQSTIEAHHMKVKSDLATYMHTLDLYKQDNGRYPTTSQGLQALVTKPTSGPPARRWKKGGYLEALAMDPWGRHYQYVSPGTSGTYDLFTLGADGKEGGSGLDADLGSQDHVVEAYYQEWKGLTEQENGEIRGRVNNAESGGGLLAWFSGLGLAGKMSSKELSRELAKKKLSVSLQYPKKAVAELPAKVVIDNFDTGPILHELQRKGLIRLTEREALHAIYPRYDIELTETGRKWLAQDGAVSGAYRVIMCTVELAEVTGIRLNGDKTQAEVHYNVKVTELSGFARLEDKGPCLTVLDGKGAGPGQDLVKGIAQMAYFDDGWRVLEKK